MAQDLSFAVSAFCFFTPAMAQEGDEGESTGTTTTSTPTPKKPTPPPIIPAEPEYTTIPQLPPFLPPSSNLFISGFVVSEDGSAPPFGATIEMDCGSSLTRQAEVDSDGYFSFQVGGNKHYGFLMPDAPDAETIKLHLRQKIAKAEINQ